VPEKRVSLAIVELPEKRTNRPVRQEMQQAHSVGPAALRRFAEKQLAQAALQGELLRQVLLGRQEKQSVPLAPVFFPPTQGL
jgi:hypothetical protein